MRKINLPNVTLFGVDCVDIKRLTLAADICQKHFNFGQVKLLTSIKNKHPHTIAIKPIKSVNSYSKFMVEHLHKYIDTEFVLVIQYDGFLIKPRGLGQ